MLQKIKTMFGGENKLPKTLSVEDEQKILKVGTEGQKNSWRLEKTRARKSYIFWPKTNRRWCVSSLRVIPQRRFKRTKFLRTIWMEMYGRNWRAKLVD